MYSFNFEMVVEKDPLVEIYNWPVLITLCWYQKQFWVKPRGFSVHNRLDDPFCQQPLYLLFCHWATIAKRVLYVLQGFDIVHCCLRFTANILSKRAEPPWGNSFYNLYLRSLQHTRCISYTGRRVWSWQTIQISINSYHSALSSTLPLVEGGP